MFSDASAARRLENATVEPGDPMYEPRLSKGLSVKFALFPDADAPVMSKEVDQAAGLLYARLRQGNRDLLMRCDGKSLGEARRILAEGGVEGITLVTKAVDVAGGGRYRIDPAVTGITPLLSSITISGPGGSRRLMIGTCCLVNSAVDAYFCFDLPPGARFKANVGLSDASASPFVEVDPVTGEPVDPAQRGPGDVAEGVRLRVCGDVKDI